MCRNGKMVGFGGERRNWDLTCSETQSLVQGLPGASDGGGGSRDARHLASLPVKPRPVGTGKLGV